MLHALAHVGPQASAGPWPFMCAVTFGVMCVLVTRATWDIENWEFDDDARGWEMSYDPVELAAHKRLCKWRDSLLVVLENAPQACRDRVHSLVDNVKAQWKAHTEQYLAARAPENQWDPDMEKPEFPGRMMYMQLLSDASNTVRGWCPTVISEACHIIMEIKTDPGPGKQLEIRHLYISSCIMDVKSTVLAAGNCLGEDFKHMSLMLVTVVLFATDGLPEAAVKLYKEYLEGVSSDEDYCREHENLKLALRHNARDMTKHMVCTYGGMPRLSTNTILSVRSSRSSSAHQTTSDLEALFASCTLSVDLQNMANTADTSAALWPLRFCVHVQRSLHQSPSGCTRWMMLIVPVLESKVLIQAMATGTGRRVL